MSDKATGVVEKVSTSFSKDPNKKWTKRSFLVGGKWYGMFINDKNKDMLDAVREGDSVSVTYVMKGEFINLENIQTLDRAAAPANVAGAKNPGAPVPYDPSTKDFRITFLASRKDSIEFVKMLLAHDVIPLGTKKGDKADIIYGLINKYAAKMAADAWHPTAIKDESITEAVEEAKTYAVE